MTLNKFMTTVGAGTAVPGGGSCAAVLGAMGVSLLEMVANLTVGKKKYAEHDEELRRVLVEVKGLRATFFELADKDSAVFMEVMKAFKLPKGTDEEKAARFEALQKAYCAAAEVPHNTAKYAVQGLQLARRLAEIGNANAITDAGVAGLSLFAALRGAVYNVEINLCAIADDETCGTLRGSIDKLMGEGRQLAEEIEEAVKSNL